MKFLLWHIHEWIYNERGDVRKCSDCGKIHYGVMVGFDEDATMHWQEQGFTCKECGGVGETLEGTDIVACNNCGGKGTVTR